ncbi:MAG: YbaN family protein [Pseudomonadota bacterium]
MQNSALIMLENRWTLRRSLWALAGAVALILGAIGVVLPLLPTTPFVILSAFAFSKSIPGMQRWLENSRLFGPAIKDWNKNGAIAPKYKFAAMVMMLLFIALSIILEFSATVITIQIVCMSAAAIYVLSRPNGKKV